MQLNIQHSRGRLRLPGCCLGNVCICVSDNFMDFLLITLRDFSLMDNSVLCWILKFYFALGWEKAFTAPTTPQLLFDNKKKWCPGLTIHHMLQKKIAKLKSEKIKSAALCLTQSAFMCSHRFRLFANFQRILQQEPMTLAS